jgi:hypothetical protein
MRKKIAITILLITGVLILAAIILSKSSNGATKETAACIAKNSVLYIQLGCHACGIQQKYFGESYQYLNVVDCFFNQNKCIAMNITATPTWIIGNKKYTGAQKIEKLKELTGCK